MSILFIAILVLLLLAFFFIFIQPLVPLLLLKLKFGDKAIIMFYPIFGFVGIFMRSIKTNQDVMKSINDALRNNPKAKIILSNFLNKPCIMFAGTEYLKQSYQDHDDFEKLDPFMLPSFMQKGLAMSEGENWKRQRKFLAPAFTFEKLKSRLLMMNQVVEDIAEKDDKTNLNDFMSRITGDIVLGEGFKLEGKDAQIALTDLTGEISLIMMDNLYAFIKSLLFGVKTWSILPTKQEKDVVRRVENVRVKLNELILKRIEQLKESPVKDQDKMVFLDLYVTEYLKQQTQKEQSIDIEEILHQFITLFFAGTDTTATACGTCLYYLAKYPEIQSEILEEFLIYIWEQISIIKTHTNQRKQQSQILIFFPIVINLIIISLQSNYTIQTFTLQNCKMPNFKIIINLMSILFIAILVLLLLAFFFIFIQPLVPLLLLKLKFGDKAIIMFYPIFGFVGIFMRSIKTNQDVMKSINDALRNNPKAKIILSNFLNKPCIMFAGTEYLKQSYQDHDDFEKLDPFMLPSFMQKGLAMSEGENWKRQRKFLAPAFTFEKLKSRLLMMNQVVEDIAEKDDKTNLNDFMSRITGDIVLGEGFKLEGKDAQIALTDLTGEISLIMMDNLYAFIKSLLFGVKTWSILPTKQEKDVVRRVENVRVKLNELILKRIEQLKESPVKDQDKMVFLDLYVTEYLKQQTQKEQSIDIEEILHQFITLFFAGTDTTATACGTCLYYLAKYPEIQSEILEEVREVIGDADVNEENLNKLTKVNALIQEVLRLRNPAFVTLFRTVKRDKQVQDIKLKKGWALVQMHNANSILDQHYDNATEFNYKRWLNKGNVVKNDDGYIHIPFTAGPRNCIGQHMALMESKIIIALIVRKYKILLNPAVQQIRFGIKFLQCVEPDNCLLFEKRI
ncbi:unnamed protein product [Paramecium octaurelia]|uniref:Cytochrome P450 n=1 Tax=Paramecium octaurelia TaxID=43137 RepID=A0A8S1USJ8_PAROT|nr:unnamed protein product [Paramecium octaurelia]